MYFLDVHIPPHHDWNLKVKKCVQWLLYPLRFFVDFPNLYRLHRSQLHFYYLSTHVLFQKNIFCFGFLISRIIIKMSCSSHVFWFQRFMEEIMKRTNTTQASSCFQFSIFCSHTTKYKYMRKPAMSNFTVYTIRWMREFPQRKTEKH